MLCIGFFMILVDTTIVVVAQPMIQTELGTSINAVVWVTSAYLLAYAVPLLISGRLGDRFGPRNLYVIGLIVFTLASIWCGFSGSIGMLIAARVVQGFGAALLNPQTMAVITRIFPPAGRGAAMGIWGAVAGVATLVGPLLGGVLVDSLGWEWIFFINVPIGVVGVVLALRYVPKLPTNDHRFDWVGTVLSGAALFLVIFGIQEGQGHDWSLGIWALIVGGAVLFVVFLWWQRTTRSEPLVPLGIFKDRNFSVAAVGIGGQALAMNAMFIPAMYYLQKVAGLDATQAAAVTIPMAVATGLLAPGIGKVLDRTNPRNIIVFGLAAGGLGVLWFALCARPDAAIWTLLLPMALMGVGGACTWAPLAATANRNLPPSQAGAGAGVYNTVRMIGSVLGSAGIAALLESRLAHHLGDGAAAGSETAGPLPAGISGLREGFADAMSEALWLPVIVLFASALVSLLLVRPAGQELPAKDDVAV